MSKFKGFRALGGIADVEIRTADAVLFEMLFNMCGG
jgi:hypothetical protein